MQQIYKNIECFGKKGKKIKKGKKNLKETKKKVKIFFAPPFRKAGYGPGEGKRIYGGFFPVLLR